MTLLSNFCFKVRQRDFDEPRITVINKRVIMAYNDLFKDLNAALKVNFKGHLSELRTYCFGLTRLFIATELLSHMFTTLRDKDIEVLERWLDLGIYTREGYSNSSDKKIGMDLNDRGISSSTGDIDSRGKPRSRL